MSVRPPESARRVGSCRPTRRYARVVALLRPRPGSRLSSVPRWKAGRGSQRLAEQRWGGRLPRRIAMLSVHTSPLDQPGTGDAGGMNVYVVELSRRLAALGIEVEIFTRATSGDLPPVMELAPGVLVRHIAAGPFEGLDKVDLPSQLCAFT